MREFENLSLDEKIAFVEADEKMREVFLGLVLEDIAILNRHDALGNLDSAIRSIEDGQKVDSEDLRLIQAEHEFVQQFDRLNSFRALKTYCTENGIPFPNNKNIEEAIAAAAESEANS
jgi:protein gp37